MIVAGAGGFALQLIPTLERFNKLQEVFFYVDTQVGANPIIERHYPVIRGIDSLQRHWETHGRDFIVAVGGQNREAFYNRLLAEGGIPVSIIDPGSSISALETQIGRGTVILQDVLIEPGVKVGEGCLINVRATLTHKVQVGRFVELSPGIILLGGAAIGNNSFLGASAVVLPEVKIGNDCIIGSGAVVNRHVADTVKVAGVPAKTMNSR
jgi:sugar O-acyltransferase (sialic acid O-acetyltransferase NeuD family)